MGKLKVLFAFTLLIGVSLAAGEINFRSDQPIDYYNDLNMRENNIENLSAPQHGKDAVRLQDLSGLLNRSGDTMSGSLDLDGNDILNVSEITNFFQNSCGANEAVKEIKSDGSVVCGQAGVGLPTVLEIDNTADRDIDMNGYTFGNLSEPQNGDQPVRLQDISGEYLGRDGDTMNGTLDMDGNNIILNGGYLSNDGDNEGISVTDSGRVGLSEGKLDLKGASRTYSKEIIDTGFGDFVNTRANSGQFSIWQLEAPAGGEEATISLMRGEDAGNPEFIDFFNLDTVSGINVQSRGGGSLKPFKFQFNSGSGPYDVLNINPSGYVLVPNKGLNVSGGNLNLKNSGLNVGNSRIFDFGADSNNLVLRGDNRNPGVEFQVKGSSDEILAYSPSTSTTMFKSTPDGSFQIPSGSLAVSGTTDTVDLDNPGNAITLSGNQYLISSGAIGSNELGSNAVTASGGELDSSVAGNQLSLNSGSIGVVEGSGSGLNADLLDGVQLGNIDWGDVAMQKTDVSPGDVDLATLTPGTGVSGNGYDGTTARTFTVDWTAANDLGSGGTISDFSAANDLDSNGDVSSLTDVNTDALSEGSSNKYYTASRARSDVRASDVGLGNVENIAQSSLAGDQLSWDSTNNEIDLSGSLYGDEDAQDAAASALTGSGATSVNYDDSGNTITVESTDNYIGDTGTHTAGGKLDMGSNQLDTSNGELVVPTGDVY